MLVSCKCTRQISAPFRCVHKSGRSVCLLSPQSYPQLVGHRPPLPQRPRRPVGGVPEDVRDDEGGEVPTEEGGPEGEGVEAGSLR